MKKEDSYEQATFTTLSAFYPTNSRGGRIIDILIAGAVIGTLYQEQAEGLVKFGVEGQEQKLMAELSEETQYDIYAFIETHKHHPPKVKEEVKLEGPEKMDWIVEPEEVKGFDGQTVGRVGVANLESREALAGVIFISPDGSWATLTAFSTNETESMETGMMDLRAIADKLNKIALKPTT